MKKRIISFLLVVLLLSASVVPAFAADDSEVKNQYEDLKSIAEIIKMYGLFSSQDDDPIQNMLLDLLRSDPKEFYKLANTMLSHYDSHSAYLTSDENKSAFPTNVGGYVGVGITMSTDGGRIEITYVTQQSPADQAGLKAGDVIKLIDGQPVDGLTNDEIAAKIRGAEGSPVTITVMRDGKEQIFTMKRAQISNPNFESRTVEPGIEYMRLKIFNGTDTENRFNEAFSQLAKKGTKVLILDLRGNPGGLVSMAEDMMNLLVPDKDVKLYAAKNRNAKNGLYVCESNGKGIKLNNIYILVDKNSASASEIMAGSLRDLGYAKLVGTKTYGKSTGQIHFGLSNGDTLVLTVQQHILPRGETFDGVGLAPDYEVENYEMDYPIPSGLTALQTDKGVYLTHCSDRTLAIEQRLKILGYFSETPDKNFNQATLKAVNAFRRANALPEQGYCSTGTISLLGQRIAELAKTKVTMDAQYNKALELAREDAKKGLLYVVDENGNYINKK